MEFEVSRENFLFSMKLKSNVDRYEGVILK
jgi:hypothetical protein